MGLFRRTFPENSATGSSAAGDGSSGRGASTRIGSKRECVASWRREQQQGPGNSFPGNGKRRWPEGRGAELERKVGQQALEIDFLRDCLRRLEEQRKLQALSGKPLFTKRSKAGKRVGKPGC